MAVDAQLGALLVSEGVEDSGHLDQMPLVMTGQPVELARHQQGLQAEGPMPSRLGREVRLQDRNDAGTVDDPTGQLQVVPACGSSTRGVQ